MSSSFLVSAAASPRLACRGIVTKGSICLGAPWGPPGAPVDVEDIGRDAAAAAAAAAAAEGFESSSCEWAVLKGVSLSLIELVIDKKLNTPSDFSVTDPIHLNALATVSCCYCCCC